jgi:hypothetical protein
MDAHAAGETGLLVTTDLLVGAARTCMAAMRWALCLCVAWRPLFHDRGVALLVAPPRELHAPPLLRNARVG